MSVQQGSTRVAAVLIGCALIACSDGTAPSGTSGLALSFAVPTNRASAAINGQVSAASLAIGSATQTLTLTKVQLIVAKVELNSFGDAEDCDDDEDECEGGCDDDGGAACTEFATGPLLIDLPLSGDLLSPIVVDVPPGTFNELEVKIGLPKDHAKLASFLSAHPGWPPGAAVHVEGTFDAGDGKGALPFDVSFPARGRFELDFNPPLVIDAQHATGNVTLTIDVISWFKTASGGFINPLLLATNDGLRMQVIRNIRLSLRAFRDDDRDGDDDHGHH